ncbi:MAG: hypothetical protein H6838_05755 [Planctomycetes bacterium]|nr:hypothetical protein [Planctomycetota bacterium]
MRRRLDRLFDTYRRTGDPRALAEVFDGCTGDLYRLAHHRRRRSWAIGSSIPTWAPSC